MMLWPVTADGGFHGTSYPLGYLLPRRPRGQRPSWGASSAMM